MLVGKIKKRIDVYETMEYGAFNFDENNRKVVKNSEFADLLESIRENGLISPIIVREAGGKLIIADGQHRFFVLKALNLPIEYYVNNDIDLSQIVSANATTVKHKSAGFLGIGANNNIKIFDLIVDIIAQNYIEKDSCKIPYTAVLGTAGTFFINNKESIYSNTKFIKGCKINLKRTLASMDVNITSSQEKEFYNFIDKAKKIALAVGKKSLKVNFNRELLKFYLAIGDVKNITIDELLTFLIKEKPKEFSFKNRLRLASTDKEFRSIIVGIAGEIEKKKSKKRRLAA